MADDSSQPGFFRRFAGKLGKSRAAFGDRLADAVLGKRQIDEDLYEEIETLLLGADLGIETTERVMDMLRARVRRRRLDDSGALAGALRDILLEMISPAEQPLEAPAGHKPFVLMTVGVNGSGKTTTIGKLARRFTDDGHRLMLAAGDTFRAAAVEQLQTWGERMNVPVIAQGSGADSASVVFDALNAARARGSDVLIADTAGRLHTQGHLMEELKKIKRVLGKLDPETPHEVLLVLDGGTGQNALRQAREFHRAIGVTGLAVTKLDGTAKGGVLFALADELKLPIRYIGVGESADDLRPFDAEAYVDALLPEDAG